MLLCSYRESRQSLCCFYTLKEQRKGPSFSAKRFQLSSKSRASATAGDSIVDWYAFDLARLDTEPKAGKEAYLKALEQYVTDAYATPDKLSRNESTPWARVALCVYALGGDPTSFGTDPDGKPINLLADGIYNWSQTSDLGYQGTNAWIYALYTLDCVGAEVPADARYTRETIKQNLLAAQNSSGAFGLVPGGSNIDITSMAIVALAPYVDELQVNRAVQSALAFLAYSMGGDGTLGDTGVASSESCAMAILALCSVGIDPTSDPDFTKNGHTLVDGLLSFQREDGSFSHSYDDDLSFGIQHMPTEQSMRALMAIEEFKSGGDGDVYTFDVEVVSMPDGSSGSGFAIKGAWLGVGIVVGVALVAILSAINRRKKQYLPLD